MSKVNNLIKLIADEVKQQTSADSIIDLRPAKMNLSLKPADADEFGAYMIGLNDEEEVFVCTGPESGPMTADDELLEDFASLLLEFGASEQEVEALLENVLKALKVVAVN